ncbi:hypothetical protein LCGC14_2787150, partial [marine sediment metagenome]
MSPVNQYKRVEDEFVDRAGKKVRKVWGGLLSFLKLVIQKGKQRFTVMFIPHSEKRIFNFQISVFTLIFLFFILSVLILSFFGLSTHFSSTNKRIVEVTENLAESETLAVEY